MGHNMALVTHGARHRKRGFLMSITIPAPLIVQGQYLPTVCARHGEPADRHKRVVFRSRIPGWTYVLLLIAVIVFIIVALAVQKRVQAPAWPFCPKCASRRRRGLLIGFVLLVLGIVGLFLGASAPADASWAGWVAFASAVIASAGLIFVARSNWAMAASGIATRDGTAVDVLRPAPEFAESIAATQQWALQQQQAAQQQWTQQQAAQQQWTQQQQWSQQPGAPQQPAQQWPHQQPAAPQQWNRQQQEPPPN